MASDRIRGNSHKKTVILDSNALLMVFEFSINLEEELTRLLGSYHIGIPTAVVSELKLLEKHGKGAKKQKAIAALTFITRYNIIDSKGSTTDDAIVEVAKRIDGIVVTNDKELKRRLKVLDVPVIFLRKKQQLVLE